MAPFELDKLYTSIIVRQSRQQVLCRETLDKLWDEHDLGEFLDQWNFYTDYPTQRDQAAWCLEKFLKLVDALIHEEVEYGFLPQLRDLIRVYWGKFYEHYIFDDFTHQEDLMEFEELVSTFKAQYRSVFNSSGAYKHQKPWKRNKAGGEMKCFVLPSFNLKPSLRCLGNVKKRGLAKWRGFRRRVVPRSVRFFYYDHFC